MEFASTLLQWVKGLQVKHSQNSGLYSGYQIVWECPHHLLSHLCGMFFSLSQEETSCAECGIARGRFHDEIK